MNVSDSVNTRSTYVYRQQVNANKPDGKQPSTNGTSSADSSQSTRLQALKAQMQSGQPIDLNRLADSMLRKSTAIDVQA
ncbi:hypothetical protein [Alicyclobacillus acidiphilus]|uniref:hypothetical protein n=1 Tax=Alicyclobacillus acidiphilus TaxID=182455 RepID=UPI00082A7C94|nr:hypothetical protein [Alicyclobacillus acidiphilus]